ncbi:C39 family peptidase [Candidatus Dependentiae bacterium]|nr:C39 family peptidase [Candidatus Dependentiae bacterium]
MKKTGILFFLCIFLQAHSDSKKFSHCLSVVIPKSTHKIKKHPELSLKKTNCKPYIIWQKNIKTPFSELILSWNASRPKKGHFSFWVNVKNHQWSGWKKLATWGATEQKTFSCTKSRYVHTKHVRIEMQRKHTGCAFQVKVVANNGADIRRVKALFINASNWDYFREQNPPITLPSTLIEAVPKQSQWWLKHKRNKDLCSPTSISMISRYFAEKKNIPTQGKKLTVETKSFANKVRDQSLNIFGNWLFNTAQAFNTTRGSVLYRVERLNNFESLHKYLANEIPVAVSIRGNLRGHRKIRKSSCAWPYKNGHFVVVSGWDQARRTVTCLDPAFNREEDIVRHYQIDDFIQAWGRSRNLSYVPIPQKTP